MTTGASTFSCASRSATEVAVPCASRGFPSSSRVAASLPVRVSRAPFSSLTGPNSCTSSDGIIMALITSGRYPFSVTTERVKAQKALSAFLRITGSISSPEEVMMPAAPMEETGAM
ncbi:hypothetical protein V3C20_00585 [Akkermansia sp. RCC_12PD]|uniref:hypothetical protein n=1 Tax=Akkermansia sp. RCC_12PD TaxID=3115152 RepID=UPI002ED84EE7